MLFSRTSLSRRELLTRGAQAVAGLAAASALNVPALAAGVPGAKPAAKMRFGLTAYQWGDRWDLPTMIANCTKAGALGAELRTSENYVHGVELEIGADRRREVKKLFADSPVTLVGLATSEKFDWPDPEKLKAAIENTKLYLDLSRDIGGSGVRVFVNDFQKNIPHEQTQAQAAKALNVVGAYAADCGQQVRLECHGTAGDLPSIRAIMDQVTQRSVRVKLNSEPRNTLGQGFEHNFNLVKDFLGNTLHAHNFKDDKFPNQLQINLLAKMGWTGWVLMEASMKVPDRVAALAEQRELFEQMLAKATGQ